MAISWPPETLRYVVRKKEAIMPTPRKDETQKDFVSRCIPYVLKEGTAESRDQVVAICFSMWREHLKEKRTKR